MVQRIDLPGQVSFFGSHERSLQYDDVEHAKSRQTPRQNRAQNAGAQNRGRPDTDP